MNNIKIRAEERKFNYEQPEMTYDKETGDVIIHEKSANKKTRIINNYDDLEKEKKALMSELEEKTGKKQKKGQHAPSEEERTESYAASLKKFTELYDVDPTQFQVFSRDMMRVDVGMIVQRPPIFLHMRPRDVEFMKLRSQTMNEF